MAEVRDPEEIKPHETLFRALDAPEWFDGPYVNYHAISFGPEREPGTSVYRSEYADPDEVLAHRSDAVAVAGVGAMKLPEEARLPSDHVYRFSAVDRPSAAEHRAHAEIWPHRVSPVSTPDRCVPKGTGMKTELKKALAQRMRVVKERPDDDQRSVVG
jgi:hypothetical protein